MTGSGDTSEIDEFTLDEAEDAAEDDAAVADEREGSEVEDDDEDAEGQQYPPVGSDLQLNASDSDPSAGASDIGGVSPGPGDS